jgi:iron complex outermembrane receptor protein
MFIKSSSGRRIGKKLLCGASLIAIAITFAGQSMAQEATLATESVTVSATGTSIKGINPVGSNMVTIDAAAMKTSGALTTNQILEQIPQLSNAFNTNAAVPSNPNQGGFRPSIRNLPSQAIVGGSATLLLLDGHNFIGISGLGTAPDAGVIPTIVLRRVDVLPDGASSVYGANAITGVINFITRDSFSGFQTQASVGMADGYSSFSASVMGGTDWADGGAYLAYEHKNNTMLLGADRSYTKMDLTSIGGRDSRATACGLPNISVAGGKNYAVTALPSAAAGSLAANVTGPFGGLNAVTNAGSLNRCDTNSYSSMFPSEIEDSLFGNFHQKIIEGVEFSTKVLWSTRLESATAAQQSATGTIDTTNPYFQSIGGETQQTVQFNFSPYFGSNNFPFTSQVQVFQVTPKITAQLPFGDWEAVLMANYGRSYTNGAQRAVNTSVLNNALRQTTVGGVLSANLVAGANSVGTALDPYNINLNNPLVVNQITNFQGIFRATQHQLQYQIAANGTLFSLPGGPVKAAIGGKYSWEDFNQELGATVPIGQTAGAPIPGSQLFFAKIHRVVQSGFAEVNVPIVGEDNRLPFVHSLTFNMSGRTDSYSDFGQTNNFKLGFAYEPFSDLTIRGTRGTSYDAPSLADLTGGRFNYTPQRTSANAIVPPGTSAADALRPSILLSGGNRALGPELGSTWSIGADFHPTNYGGMDFTGLDLSITAYHIKIEHQLGLSPFNSPLLFQVPGYSKYYIINPTLPQLQSYGNFPFVGGAGTTVASAYDPGVNPPYILYDARRNNLGNAVLEGFDFAASYTRDIEDFGSISGGISGTYSTNNSTQADPTSAFVSIQATGVPLYAASGYLSLVTGPWTGRVSVQYSPGFNVNPGDLSLKLYNQHRISAFHPVNAYLGYDLSGLTGWLNNAEASVTVSNMFDENPPIYLAGGTSAPVNGGQGITAGSTLGRYAVFSLQKMF